MSDEELAVITEEAGQIATFEQLVIDDQLEEAVNLGNTFMQRLSDDGTKWKRRINEIDNILRKRATIERREQKWARYDQRVVNLQRHHPDYYDQLLNEHGRDLPGILSDWSCRGNEKHACLSISVKKSYWSKHLETQFCQFFSDNAEEFDAHRISSQHLHDDEWATISKAYRSFEIGRASHGGVVHRAGSRHLKEGTLAIRIGDQLLMQHGRFCNIIDLCKQCWKVYGGKCERCEGPLTKKGDCVLECA